MRTASGQYSDDCRKPLRAGWFFEQLSSDALNEFESLKVPFSFQANTVLFIEEQIPSKILFLLEGQVKLSMNSSAGRRLILGIAHPGEKLRLAKFVPDTCQVRRPHT